jgi:hypothetical protein
MSENMLNWEWELKVQLKSSALMSVSKPQIHTANVQRNIFYVKKSLSSYDPCLQGITENKTKTCDKKQETFKVQ